jgi:PAS domain S-box-containing protein
LRLLFIEDQPDDADLIESELRRSGFAFEAVRVDTLAGVRDALAAGGWSAILCDANLPGFHGHDALRLVRAHDREIPFLIVSGVIGEERAVDMIRDGANDYINKDHLGRLAPALERELRDVQLRRERNDLFDALRRSEERYRRIFEHAPIGVAVSTPDGRLVTANDLVVRTIGYPRSELLGHRLSEFAVDANDGDGPERAYRRKDGSVVWASVTRAPIELQGEVTQIVWLIEDITARRYTQDRLSLQQRLLDSVEQAVVATDLAGSVIYWNRFAEVLYGWTAENILGRSLIDLVPTLSAESAAPVLQRLLRGESWSGEVTLRKYDGTQFPAWVIGGPFFDANGRVIGVVGVSYDMSERKRAEDELRSSREQLADAQRIARLGSWEYDLATGRRVWSDELYRIFGYEPEEEPSVALFDARIHPHDLPYVQARRVQIMEEQGPFDDLQRLIMPDGEIRWAQGRGRFIHDEQGRPIKIMGVVQDVTESRNASHELQRRAILQAAVANLGHVALSGAPMDALIAQTAAVVSMHLDVDLCSIAEQTDDGFRFAGGDGWDDLEIGALIDGSHPEYTLSTRAPVVFEDLAAETRFTSPRLLQQGVVSGALVPIIGGHDEWWGVLGAFMRTPRQFATTDIDFLRSVATILGQAAERHHAEAQARRRERQQNAIAELSRLALRSAGDETLARTCELLTECVDADFALVYELEADQLRYRAGRTWLDAPIGLVPLTAAPQAANALLLNEPNVIGDYWANPDFRRPVLTDHGIRSGIAVPISSATYTFGVLAAYSRRVDAINDADVHFIEALANIIAEAVARERAGLALAASEQRYREVVEGATEVIFTISMDGTFTSVNAAFEKVTGWNADEWIGRKYIELVDPNARMHSGSVFKRVVANQESVSDVLPIIGRHGPVLIELTSFPKVENGRTAAIYGFARDVTAARRAEQERQRLTRNLQLLLESTVEGIVTADLDGRCTLSNAAAASLIGRKPEEVHGANLHELLHGAHDDAETCPVFAIARTGGVCTSVVDTFRTAGGSTIPVEYSAAPIVDDGKPVGIVISFTDITDRRKLESKLEQANRLSSLGRLAATVAHEFNNVLMGISPFVELLRRGKNPETALDYIGRAVKRGRRITEDILRFTQPAVPVRVAMEVAPWLQNVCVEARSLLPQTCAIDVQVRETDLCIDGDPNQLQQIFTNLILNARDAMPQGGTLTIAAQREPAGAKLPFAVEHPESFAHFVVRDTGSGMPPETLRHIFEPLFTTKKNGTGLGLPVAHQVVQRHGGEMFVESTVGSGTAFHIFLPLTAAAAAAQPAEVAPEAPRAELTHHVLLVEDDRNVSSGLTALLELEGMTVQLAESGADAIVAVQRSVPDLVVLDVGLPDMEGIAVYERIATDYPNLPVIFSTGHGDRSKVEQLLSRPNVEYLLKPYEAATLIEAIRHVVAA